MFSIPAFAKTDYSDTLLALFAAYPNRQVMIGAGILLFCSAIIFPTWPREWLAGLSEGKHLVAPISHLGGPLILIALLRWRQPEARLLVALSCIPQSPVLYEAVPLFLIPQTWVEAGLLSLLTAVTWTATLVSGGFAALEGPLAGRLIVWLLYFPCVVMVLSRKNVRSTPYQES